MKEEEKMAAAKSLLAARWRPLRNFQEGDDDAVGIVSYARTRRRSTRRSTCPFTSRARTSQLPVTANFAAAPEMCLPFC